MESYLKVIELKCVVFAFLGFKFLLALQTEFKVSSFILISFTINNAHIMLFGKISVELRNVLLFEPIT